MYIGEGRTLQPKNAAVSESTPLCMAIYIEPRFRIIMSHYTIVKVMQRYVSEIRKPRGCETK